MMPRYYAGSHGFCGTCNDVAAKYQRWDAAIAKRGENCGSIAEKFDSDSLTLHVFSIR
jgi:hypothetical protein